MLDDIESQASEPNCQLDGGTSAFPNGIIIPSTTDLRPQVVAVALHIGIPRLAVAQYPVARPLVILHPVDTGLAPLSA